MGDQSETLEAFRNAGLTMLFDWVGSTAYARVAQEYDEAAGHDQSVIGFLGYKYCLNLFDRATSSGGYALPDGEPTAQGRDILRSGMTDEAFRSMPTLDPNLVNRRNFRGSPAWAWNDTRWVLQSFPFGGIDEIVWGRKSDSKQAIAQQAFDNGSAALFEYADFDIDEPPTALDNFVGSTLVLAHTFDHESGDFEMYLGRSRLADAPGRGPWHWRSLVATNGTDPNGIRLPHGPELPGSAPTSSVADAEVRLRRGDEGRSEAAGSGA
jgi:hypothetical protein